MIKFMLLCFRLLLVMCFTSYGTLSMAKAGGNGELVSIEICADGVVKTVLAGPDGIPVEPTVKCPECLTCCQASAALTSATCVAAPSNAVLELTATQLVLRGLISTTRDILPQPRAPPLAKDADA